MSQSLLSLTLKRSFSVKNRMIQKLEYILKTENKTPVWINVAFFHGLWLICVQANDLLALAALAIYLLIHQLLFVRKNKEWIVIVAFTLVGIILDGVQLNIPLIQFSGAISINVAPEILIPPIWLICLWVGFATTLAHGFRFFLNNIRLAVAATLVAVPFSYMVGTLMSGSELVMPIIALLVEGLGWAIIFPVGLILTDKLLKPVQKGL